MAAAENSAAYRRWQSAKIQHAIWQAYGALVTGPAALALASGEKPAASAISAHGNSANGAGANTMALIRLAKPASNNNRTAWRHGANEAPASSKKTGVSATIICNEMVAASENRNK